MAKGDTRVSRVRWDDKEWCAVLDAALPVAQAEGIALDKAVCAVQSRVLPRSRVRKYSVIHNALRVGAAPRKALEKVKAMHATKRDPQAQGRHARRMPGDAPDVKELRASYTGGVHWTDYEWALIAREIARMRRDNPDAPTSECRAVIEAQDRCLPITRRRAVDGLRKQFYSAKTSPYAKQALESARQHMGRILAQPMPALLADALAADPLPVAATPAATVTASTPDSPAPRAVESAPVEAAPVAQAPQRDDVPRVSPAALKFATTLAYAVDSLLTDHTAAVVAQVGDAINSQFAGLQARMQGLGEALAADVSGRIASDIQGNLARVVHLLMEKELGPIAPPSPGTATNGHAGRNGHAGAVLGDTPTDSEQRPKRIPVDVVGLTGEPVRIVADAFRDATHLDIRFLEPKQARNADYRGNVIAVTKFLSHGATSRMEAQGVNVLRVSGAAQSVIAAMNTLQEKVNGAALHH